MEVLGSPSFSRFAFFNLSSELSESHKKSINDSCSDQKKEVSQWIFIGEIRHFKSFECPFHYGKKNGKSRCQCKYRSPKTLCGYNSFKHLFQFFVTVMPIVVAFGLDIQLFLEGFFQVYASLICQTQDNKNNVGKFFAQVFVFVAFLFTLFAIAPSDNASYFSYLFSKLRHIRKLVEVPDAVCLNPFVNSFLCVF